MPVGLVSREFGVMQGVSLKTHSDSPCNRRKRGIGILEVMVAALVLGILYAAVSNLQKGNRDALLRIRGRDGATEVAQNIIDKLGVKGLAYFTDANLKKDDDNNLWLKQFTDSELSTWLVATSEKEPDTIKISRTWKGQPGLVENTMSVDYKVIAKFSSDEDYDASATTQYLQTTLSSNSHIYAKRLDVIVSWPFNGSTQSISVSGVIR